MTHPAGAPIRVPHTETPTSEELDEAHGRYVAALAQYVA